MSLTVVASALLLGAVLPGPVLAQLDKDEVKCRPAIAGTVTKLVNAGLKTVAAYTKQRDAGKLAADADVVALAAADPKLVTADAKAKEKIIGACEDLG